MEDLKRHQMVFKILTPIIKPFVKWKFNYSYDDLSKIEGPYLLLVNHNMELDPALVGVSVGHQIYFVASEHIMRKGLGTWAIKKFFDPIIHLKGRQGINTVKQMMKTLRDGKSLCIFPEGDRSFNGLTRPILPSIAKVARRSGAKLVTYRIEGGYFTQPRWSLSLRKGRMRGRLIKEYSVEALKSMTNEQVNDAICRDLFEDAYETQRKERIPYRGKHLALGMESTLFVCPKCKRIGTLTTNDNRLLCDCGFFADYDVYGDLKASTGEMYTITGLDQMQLAYLRMLAGKADKDTAIFSDDVTVYQINNNHEIMMTQAGKLEAYTHYFKYCENTWHFDDMEGMAIYSRNSMTIHLKGKEGHFEIKSNESFCALKYLYLYEINRGGC